MAKASNLKEGIQKEFLQCNVCLEPFKDPRCLPCLHAYCSNCLKGLMRGKTRFPCPTCKQPTNVPRRGIDGFNTDFRINALQDFIKGFKFDTVKPTIPCFNRTHGAKHARATVKCFECNVYYCKECNTAHKKAALAAKHVTIQLSELTEKRLENSDHEVSYCESHPSSTLIFYCKQEKVTGCQKCYPVHKNHDTQALKEFAIQCRYENDKLLLEDFSWSEKALQKRKMELKEEIQKSNKDFDENKKVINDRYLKMMEELKCKEERLINDAKRSRDKAIRDYEHQLAEVDAKIASLKDVKAVVYQMTKFALDEVIVKHHEDLQQNAKITCRKTIPDDLFVRRSHVTNTGKNFLVDMKMAVEYTKRHKSIKCFDGTLTDFVLIDEFLVAWDWQQDGSPTSFFVNTNCSLRNNDANSLKTRLEGLCPYAYRMVPLKINGLLYLAISEKSKNHIKFLNLDTYDIIRLDRKIHPGAIAVDRNDDIIFTDLGTSKAIRKLTIKNQKVETIYENKSMNIFGHPWHIFVDGNIIISDCEKKSLITFDATGNHIRTDTNFEGSNPCGLCADGHGNIYVSDHDDHCIYQFDRNGEFQDYKLTQDDGLQNPQSVAYKDGRLFIGQADGHIKIYEDSSLHSQFDQLQLV